MSKGYDIREYPDADALADAAAARIGDLLKAGLRERGRAVAALSGGSTPQRAYAKLSKVALDWPRVNVTLVDDRWAPPQDPRSNQNLLDMTLFYKGAEGQGADGARFTPLYTGDATPEAGADKAEYAVKLLARPFDVVVLGMGDDGHTASLFPGGDRLAEGLDLNSDRLLLPMRAPGAAEPRITLTLAAILQARRILLLFSGEKKHEVFRKALADGPVEDMPIRAILRQTRTPVEVLCSGAALPAAVSGVEAEAAALRDQWTAPRARPTLSLFEEDAERFAKFSASLGDMLLDYSKTRLTAAARDGLFALARAAEVEKKRDALFAGAHINATEDRAVLHMALRAEAGDKFADEGASVVEEVLKTRARCFAFAESVRLGVACASDGQPFTDVVNIGIGGSDLGPAMATLALAPYHDGPRAHFVSNVDGAHIADTLKALDPRRTLVLVASKTFTTVETMTNAETARKWIASAVGEAEAGAHFAAISTAGDKAAAFGIPAERVFGFRDWVGGRYSVWSPVGLSLMIAIGPKNFGKFLQGAREVDRHLQTAPMEKNLPLLMGLIGVWHRNICGYGTRAVLPYDQRLNRLPAYLQQLDMESNGKTARLSEGLTGPTGPVVWGEPGTNGQHAFHQLLHQGADVIPCEFLLAAEGHEPDLAHHHELLISNCLAQSEALMRGRSEAEAVEMMLAEGMDRARAEALGPHRAFPGDRPSTMLIYRRLDPRNLGRIIALYEHRVFVEGAIWGINSFDQWGVELGKSLATELLPMVRGAPAAGRDGSTAGLIAQLRARRS
jgi:glucose-6-phosphate isomerase